MITARKVWMDVIAGPMGMPGIKSVSIELRDEETGWSHTEAVGIAPGDAATEQAQLDRAVANLMKRNGRTGEWTWQ